MRSRWTAVGCALAGVASAVAQVELPDSAASARESVAVTAYNDDLALVREVRKIELPRVGVGTLRFMDVPSAIDPRTVHLQAAGGTGRFDLLEQNYEYDLISPQKLMEKYVGKEVEVVLRGSDLEERRVPAVLLSVNGGPVYRVGDRVLLFQSGQVTLPSVPEDLVSRPTLVWTVDVTRKGRSRVEVSYLTGGVSWQADYVAVLAEEDTKLDLNGWVTVSNRSGAGFENALLKLVAGNVRRLRGTRFQASPMDREKAAAPGFAQEELFEYHLYTLERPTTLKNNQSKQLALLSARGVPVKKRLVLTGRAGWYRSEIGTLTQPERPEVVLEFRNDAAHGLGMPLPKGTVRVYERDSSGAEQFVGEDAIDHTPAGETIRLSVGRAFDVVAERTQTDYRVLGRREAESAFRVAVRNHKDRAVTITVREPVGGDWRLVSSSHPGRKLDAGTLEFELEVPAHGETILTYRVAVRW